MTYYLTVNSVSDINIILVMIHATHANADVIVATVQC